MVLYGYEICSLIARELCRLRALANKALRRTFEHKGEKVNGRWKNYIMRSFMTYFSPNIIKVIKSRRIRWEGYVAPLGEKGHA